MPLNTHPNTFDILSSPFLCFFFVFFTPYSDQIKQIEHQQKHRSQVVLVWKGGGESLPWKKKSGFNNLKTQISVKDA